MTGVSVRLARPSDASDIVKLMRSGLTPDVRALTPYGCRGARAYVSALVGRSASWNDTVYTIARHHGRAIAASEFRLVAGGVVLNYVAVSSRSRGKGVGRQLLGESLRALAADRDLGRTFLLDVFADNRRAIDWYERLGLRRAGSFAWYDLGPSSAQSTPQDLRQGLARAQGLAPAEAVHAAFGFSTFTVEAGQDRHDVGRLGRHWYRLTDPRAARSRTLRRLLGDMDSHRRILLIARPPVSRAVWPVIQRGWRMEAPLSGVRRRLQSPVSSTRRRWR